MLNYAKALAVLFTVSLLLIILIGRHVLAVFVGFLASFLITVSEGCAAIEQWNIREIYL
ncbi:hypothetical protein T4B_14644 [Trichinella pseudospiralis]|uniref:Uncharacterized protein n=1 Tax=Trichinella pseudospiralis TaxID=6337 RepID=A0A0V1DRZ9_TRIPS|nr:hypothetical protein T4A_1207 [Trichinella pseudospiralis]KRZ01773.1 hypothetical protein T4B_14644 [Trichinella pseudospiralis]